MHRPLLALCLLAACRPAASNAPSGASACETGDAEACFDHGITFQFPETGARDLPRALALYDRACTLGEAWACVQAASVLYYGITPRDDARIADLARRACALKHEDACTKPPGEIGGVMPKQAIRAVVRGNIGQIRDCYNAGLARDPELRGRVDVTFTITPDGTVADLTLIDELPDAPDVARCIADVARAWRFPAPFGRVIVAYPFVLEPG